MNSGSPWSEKLIRQLQDAEERNEYVAGLVRARLATLIRALREQAGLSQTALAKTIGTTQSVISRIEDPEYGKLSLQTVFEVAAALGLPVFIDLPEWEDWFKLMEHGSPVTLHRRSFDAHRLISQAKENVFKRDVGELSDVIMAVKRPASSSAAASEYIMRSIQPHKDTRLDVGQNSSRHLPSIAEAFGR